jgi:nitrite reductase (NO-forming)
MRKQAVGARFAWIVRVHERAHGAFVHGGVLGVLMAVGAVKGGWYASARLAHLHVNLLGWGGLTLLATLVFFGPTMARTRIEPGADDRAAVALRHGATALTTGVLALLATGMGGSASTALRLLAAASLGVFAWSVSVVCMPVARAARTGNDETARWPITALCTWFQLVVWADALVVATGSWAHLDALGLGLVLGVLAQAITATLVYVWPTLRGRSSAAWSARTKRHAVARAVAWNAGVAAVVGGAISHGPLGAGATRVGWTLLAATLAWTMTLLVAPIRGEQP